MTELLNIYTNKFIQSILQFKLENEKNTKLILEKKLLNKINEILYFYY